MYYVYILTNISNEVMYIGVTNDLRRRVYEHKAQLGPSKSFTKRYNVSKLVYFERFPDPQTALRREKQLKKWKRDKKNELVYSSNPRWEDLFPKLAL